MGNSTIGWVYLSIYPGSAAHCSWQGILACLSSHEHHTFCSFSQCAITVCDNAVDK